MSQDTRVSVLGSWRKGNGERNYQLGDFLRRDRQGTIVVEWNVVEGQSIYEDPDFEYLGPLVVVGEPKNSYNTDKLTLGPYLMRYDAPHIHGAKLTVVKDDEVIPEVFASYIGPLYIHCNYNKKAISDESQS